MSPLVTELHLGTHRLIHVLQAPASFEAELSALEGVTVRRTASRPCSFAMAFVVTQRQRDDASTTLAAGFEPVRMVAVDADWSALRFRRVEHVKTMARRAAGAISAPGRRKASSSAPVSTRPASAKRYYWHTREGNAVARALYERVAKHAGFIRYDFPLPQRGL